MRKMTMEITKEVYDEAVKNNNFIPEERKVEVFGIGACYGYGIYFPRVFAKDGKYFVNYEMGNTCD